MDRKLHFNARKRIKIQNIFSIHLRFPFCHFWKDCFLCVWKVTEAERKQKSTGCSFIWGFTPKMTAKVRAHALISRDTLKEDTNSTAGSNLTHWSQLWLPFLPLKCTYICHWNGWEEKERERAESCYFYRTFPSHCPCEIPAMQTIRLIALLSSHTHLS